MRRRIGVDLDHTLCKGEAWRGQSCLKAIPNKKMIDLVNKMYKTDFIVIYTARQNFLMTDTFEWLDKNGVKYHAVSNRKVPFDILIDDTAFWPWKRKGPKWI